MSTDKKNKVSNKEIAEYLILNPNFFKENPEVLNSIEIIHESGAAVSLIQKQVELLRSNYNSTTDKLMELLGIAKNNEDIFILTKELILSLINASSIEEIVALIEKSFVADFGAKKSKVLFFTESSKNLPKGRVKNPAEARNILGNLLKPGKIFCGEVNKKVAKFIFNQKTGVKEMALVPLNSSSLLGLIALGSDQPGKYSDNKDTLFLDFIAEVVSKLIDSHNA
tara:strand:- start:5181 stop:5855 length:675 start_codon:yes stop_codon:yes gene_type:complete